MKKTAIIIISALLFCMSCITVYAQVPEEKGVAISTTVPAECEITFTAGSCRIEENGKVMDGRVIFERQSVHTFRILPDDGKAVDKVFFGGKDVTSQLTDGCFTTPPLVGDAAFEVKLRDLPPEPVSVVSEEPPAAKPSDTPAGTGDAAAYPVFAAAALFSALVIVLAGARRKEN